MDKPKRIAFLNASLHGSTGKIVVDLANYCSEKGWETLFIHRDKLNSDFLGKQASVGNSKLSYTIGRIPTKLFGGDGLRNVLFTKRAIKLLEGFMPQILHIHNVHGTFVNIEKILMWAKQRNVRVVYTLHDAWACTGNCCCFYDCQKWKKGCDQCLRKESYPSFLFCNTHKMWLKKRRLFNSDLVSLFVSPSNWLKNVFLAAYPGAKVEVINNGIDLACFDAKGSKNNNMLKISSGRYIIGSAAFSVGGEKGFDSLRYFSKNLDPKKFVIFLIGGESDIKLSDNFYVLKRTLRKSEMAAFYRTCDVFVNPTKFDNYPTVNLESISCGCPVITYSVGGAAEMVVSGVSGYEISPFEEEKFLKTILMMEKQRPLSRETVSASGSNYDRRLMCERYFSLYSKA